MTTWSVVAVIGAIAILWLLMNRKTQQSEPNQPSITNRLDELRTQRASLETPAQSDLVSDVRHLASRGYDRLYEAASKAGKDDRFAHQAGVLDAAFCVLANDNASRQDDGIRRNIQMETVPFNNVPSQIGRPAIIEYLVWRTFPECADKSKIGIVIAKFVEMVVQDSEDEEDSDQFIYSMIFAAEAGWRELAIEALQKRAGDNNG